MTDEIVIRFTAQQLDVVANALGQRPYIETFQILDSIRAQVAALNAPATPPTPPNGPGPDTDTGAAPVNP